MPEDLQKTAVPTGNLYGQRREIIFQRLQHSVEQIQLNYSGKKELATESDDIVLELCESLEDAFSYGLRSQNNVVLNAVSLLQNMQEIVTGACNSNSTSDICFWDFCQLHLTPHEKQRYEELKHVRNKYGRGRAFIRAMLNENALERYVLTWLDAEEILQRFYTHWSLLLHSEMSKQLPKMLSSLKQVLFALTIDSTELNTSKQIKLQTANKVAAREEPIIYAPTPNGNQCKINAVERPIASNNSTENFMAKLQESCLLPTELGTLPEIVQAIEEIPTLIIDAARDPIEPELEFLKTPLPDIPLSIVDDFCSDDTSSQYSKSSSGNCVTPSSSNSPTDSSQQLLETEQRLQQTTERCAWLETRIAEVMLENRHLQRRLTEILKTTGIDPSSTVAGCNCLITIPHVQRMKSRNHTSSYYAYEIQIIMRQSKEQWSMLRRYRDFHKLHQSLLRTHPSVAAVDFPPKKHFGNMNLVFVEERRAQLQIYLINLVETLPQLEVCKTKAELQKACPFFREA